MENSTKVVSTLVTAQQEEANPKVEGFCGSNYSSAGTTCGSNYSSGGTSSTPEELDILI
jgi:hypothetical protein